MLSHLIYEQAEQNSAYTRTLIDYLLPAFVLMAVNLPSDSRTMEQPHNMVLANRIRAYIGTHYACLLYTSAPCEPQASAS